MQMKYRSIVIDPPWEYNNAAKGLNGTAKEQYECMSIGELKSLPINLWADSEGCVLWMWITNPMLNKGFKLLDYWGFEYKTTLTWVKMCKNGQPFTGIGFYLRGSTEHCLIATKNHQSFRTKGTLTNERSIIETIEENSTLKTLRREHSRKPDEFYRLVERLQPNCNRLDVFSRQKRTGWYQYGNEIEKF